MKKKAKSDINKILMRAYKDINKLKLKGVSKKYQAKIGYMFFWLRLTPINYKFLNNWKMPDMRTIYDIEKNKRLNICICENQSSGELAK